MATENRTEKPTPKKRQEARSEGQVAKSADLNAAVILLASIGALAVIGPSILHRLEEVVVTGLARSGSPEQAGAPALRGLAGWMGMAFLQTVAPIALTVAVAAFVANVAQVRLRLTPKAAKPSFRALNPLKGLKKVFGPNGLFEGMKATVKTAIIGAFAFMAIGPSLPELAALVGLPPSALLPQLGATVLGIALRVGAAFFVVALVDYLWQRWRHEKSLRMSRDEIRREARQHDVSPEVRGAIRRRQRDQTRRRMLADVPTADVVVTNPTHFAVALRYDGSTPAPEVVAKGADLVALAIRRVAGEHDVPVLRNPPLARALHDQVEIGQMIPEDLYASVAEVLAFVYRTAGRRRRAARRESRRAVRAIESSTSAHA